MIGNMLTGGPYPTFNIIAGYAVEMYITKSTKAPRI